MPMDQTQLNETDVNLNELIGRVLRLCKKGRWLIALTTLLAVVGANVGLRFIPAKYRSEATILVAEQQISPTFVTPFSTTPLVERVQIAAREVLSQARLLEIVNEFGLLSGKDTSPDDAVESLRKNLEIEPAPPYPQFRISFTAKTPILAQRVTKRLTDLFIERHLALEATQVKNATDLMQDQLTERRKKLSELDQSMDAFKGQYAAELSNTRSEDVEEWREAKSRLDIATASRDRASEQRALLESMLVGNLNVRLTRLQDERTALLKTFTTKHPEVVSKDQQIGELKAEMEGFQAGPRTLPHRQSTLASADPSITLAEGQLAANTLEIDSLSKEVARQTAIVAEYQRRLNKSPVHQERLSAMATERQELSNEVAELSRKQQQSGLAADMGRRREEQEFRLVDPASLPSHPSGKQKKTASLAAVAVGALAGLVLTFLLELLRPTFHNENELRRTFAPPLVLSIPELPTPKERRAQIWRTALELVAGCVVAIVIAATEFYTYMLFA
jgi:succinoglycan biosynthesis transport protein ExoP